MQDLTPPIDKTGSIEETIVSGILSGRLRPGARLGESQLGAVFGTSRTRVREALMRLEARNIVEVSPRRGWFVVEPSAQDAMMVYAARRALESGYLRALAPPDGGMLAPLHAHLDAERAAIAAGQRQELVYLMGDFHIRLAELTGNTVLTDILRDLTARTILISMMYQSDFHAQQSHDGHCRIVAALAAGDVTAAADLSIRHLEEVETGLDLTARHDPLDELRQSLDLPKSNATTPAPLPSARASAKAPKGD
ncbi:GntR family transcriptional regulator [Thioclava sp. BHET1]|nr:GntR family transcriptional regulator [Thioclava sp. BHET1]